MKMCVGPTFLVAFLISLCFAPALNAASVTGPEADLLHRAEEFLKRRSSTPAEGQVDATTIAKILDRPDPQTDFLRYAFGIQRSANKLLTESQAKELKAVIDKHAPLHSRWHDERNTVRCKWNQAMWRYAAASDVDAPPLRGELEEWMRLRMDWTLQEHLEQYRFSRDVWNVLTPQQQAMILAGQWKSVAKLDTGHTRADATAKTITRALGKPDRVAEFDRASEGWSKSRVPLHAAVSKYEREERCVVFALDLNSEPMAAEAAKKATDSYATLFLAEADATRQLVRAGYFDPAARCAKAAEEAWAEAPARFAEGAQPLISLLQP